MRLKGLIWFFAILLTLASIYQLGFSPVVSAFEKKQEASAKKWVETNFPDLKGFDKLDKIEWKKNKNLDSLENKKIYPFFGHTYKHCKDHGLKLGLDLQGGMNATLAVNLDGVIRSFSNNPKDTRIKNALEVANTQKQTSEVNFIDLFASAFKQQNPGVALNTIFGGTGKTLNNTTNEKIDINDSDAEVLRKLKVVADGAIQTTYDQIQKRLEGGLGLQQTNLSLDKNKGIINAEMPGVRDPAAVRKALVASANLQFWEVYNPFLEQNWEEILNKVSAYIRKNVDSLNSDTTENNRLFTKYFTAVFSQPIKTNDGKDAIPGSLGIIAVSDTSKMNAILNIPGLPEQFYDDAKFMYGLPFEEKGKKYVNLYMIKTNNSDVAEIEGDKITSTSVYQQPGEQPAVSMNMNASGAKLWENLTERNIGRSVAIVLDNVVYSAPTVQGKISGGSSSITMGNGQSFEKNMEEAQALSKLLNSGRLDAPAKIVADQQVGASLGNDAFRKGINAFLIAFAVIFTLMLVYYNTSGIVANIALILNLLFTVGALTIFGATLTAAGIAGLVLTIGMAVDTNVIIFERIKEELASGKSYEAAVDEGYKRSLPPVLDAHVTTFLTALILFYFGLGPVLGFATTQMLGIVLSLFCGIVLARVVTDLFTGKGKHLKYFTPISQKIFKNSNFKFIEYRKIGYIIFGIVTILGIAAMIHGFDQGVEFRGGRSYTISLPKAVDLKQIQKELKPVFDNENPIVKTVEGSSKNINITTSYKINTPNSDSLVLNTLYNGLKPHLGDMSLQQFQSQEVLRGVNTVQPSISKDLKAGAVKATIFSIVIIFLYIFLRFRDWRYSLGTIVALLHDVFVCLAVFSFLRHVVKFPLELDQHFIAAVLTVIGFSMNDTVIVFDRVREYSKKMKNADKGTIINRAINDTLSRTIMTSLTVFLTILILFIFGGEVTRGFAFAMLVGVITGTYSSIFVAAPILVDFAKDKPLGEAELFPSKS